MAGLTQRPDGRWLLYGSVLPEEFHPSRSLGWQLITWYETFLCHGPGDVQGQPLKVEDDFAEFLVVAYALDEDGRRIFHEEFISRPKGCAKSELGGAMAVGEFIGPCRFLGWAQGGEQTSWGYVYSPGEPMGRPVTSPFIRILATEEEQTGNTYDNVTVMLEYISERYAEFFPRFDYGRSPQTSTRVFLAGGGEIRPSTGSAAAKDGGKETFIVADETHLYVSRELRQMYRTVKRNLGAKRKDSEPHLLQTSTMYAPGEDSIAEQTHTLHEAGKLRRVLFDHVEGPEVSLRNRRELIKALRISYVGRKFIDYERLADDCQDERMPPSDVFRYFLNRPTSPEDAWIKKDPLTKNRVELLIPAPQTMVTLGFDGGRTDDHTALVAVRVDDGYAWPLGVWEPLAATGEVDESKVDEAVRAAMAEYDVRLFYGDPPYWQEQLGIWARDFEDYAEHEVVREWWTTRTKPVHDALERLHTALVLGQTTYGDTDDNTLTRHTLNAKTWKKGEFRLVRKERAGSPNKIDALMAWTLAFEARGDAIANGLTKPKKVRRFGPVSFS